MHAALVTGSLQAPDHLPPGAVVARPHARREDEDAQAGTIGAAGRAAVPPAPPVSTSCHLYVQCFL
ncbi:MAG: hypothetical protein NVSMB12_07970 [Acidimicrobiales bacterium]